MEGVDIVAPVCDGKGDKYSGNKSRDTAQNGKNYSEKAAGQQGKYRENFTYQHTSCSTCDGYYGPSFGEPVCATCHAFLFPEDINSPEDVNLLSEKTDDGDSGNDEPTDMCYSFERRHSSQFEFPLPGPLPPPPGGKPDRLTERLALLTTPREPDNISPGMVELLPPEVLLVVFSYLDDISLWSVGNVCKRWHHLLVSQVNSDQWRMYTLRRWPLFKPLYRVTDWWSVYTKLIESAPCKLCLNEMTLQTQFPFEENSWRRNRLRNELKSLKTDPPEGIEATPLDQMCCHWHASITGPGGSPYEGGVFYLYLWIPYSYPMRPPVVRFITRIFHPNVSRHGDIGIDSIQHNWSLALTISKVLISIQSLLTDPYCQVCMEPELGVLYQDDKPAFEIVARAWTWKYAMHDVLIPR